jgi:hypothetical protein
MFTKLGCNGARRAHSPARAVETLLRGYAPGGPRALTPGLGRRIDPVEPGPESAARKPTADLPHGGGQKLQEGTPDHQLLADWIAAGAPGPKDSDPLLQRLEVFPTEASLKPKDTLQVGVRAWYSDGHSEDVTRWARFSSSEDLVAGVGRDGRIEVKGHGEASISVQFGTLVASLRVVSPLPNVVDDKVFASASRRNFIDELVLKKLQALRIPPSPDCTDAEFVRRVPRRHGHSAGTRRGAEVRRQSGQGQAGEAHRCPAGAAGVRGLLGVQVVRSAAGVHAETAATGDVVVLALRPPECRRLQAVGPLRARHPDRERQHP